MSRKHGKDLEVKQNLCYVVVNALVKRLQAHVR